MTVADVIAKAKIMGLIVKHNTSKEYAVIVDKHNEKAYIYSDKHKGGSEFNDVNTRIEPDLSENGYIAIPTNHTVVLYDVFNNRIVANTKIDVNDYRVQFTEHDEDPDLYDDIGSSIGQICVLETGFFIISKKRTLIDMVECSYNRSYIIKRYKFLDREAVDKHNDFSLGDNPFKDSNLAVLSRDGSRLICQRMFVQRRNRSISGCNKNLVGKHSDVACCLLVSDGRKTINGIVLCKYDDITDTIHLKCPVMLKLKHTKLAHSTILEEENWYAGTSYCEYEGGKEKLGVAVIGCEEQRLFRAFPLPCAASNELMSSYIFYAAPGICAINVATVAKDKKYGDAYILYNCKLNKVVQIYNKEQWQKVRSAWGFYESELYTFTLGKVTVHEDLRYYLSKNAIEKFKSEVIDSDGHVISDKNIIYNKTGLSKSKSNISRPKDYMFKYYLGEWRFYSLDTGEEVDVWSEYI